MDVPNDRSSHHIPTPKSGGIAIVLTFLIGVIAIYIYGDDTAIKSKYFFGFLFSALLIASVSFYDDFRSKPFLFKLMTQIFAVLTVMIFGLVIERFKIPFVGEIKLGVIGYILTLLWIVGITNAFNFMDGLNGLAAGQAVIVGLFFSAISFAQGSNFVYIICYTLIAGSLGFFFFNFPKSKIFMGDVGSAFLGFVFATLSIIAALYDHSHTSLLVMPLLMFNFIFDTGFTFLRRWMKGDDIFKAHRTHLYQLLNQLGFSHVQVSSCHFLMCISQGIGAYMMINVPGEKRILMFIPFLLFQIVYAGIIYKKAREIQLV